MKIKHLLTMALCAISSVASWAQEVTWPLAMPSTSLSEIGITTSSDGTTLNANGGWYYMLNQSGNYANIVDHQFKTSATNAEPVFFNTSTGWDSQVWLITNEGYVYMPTGSGTNTWTTNTNGVGTESARFWKYTLDNGKYKLNNTSKHGSDNKFLAPNGNGADQVVYADKTANTLWSLVPAYKVELIDKLNNTYNTYISGSSSDKATALKSALEDIYSDLKDAKVTTEQAYNDYVTRINGALAVYDANLLIVNRDFEAATWNQGWNGTGSTKKSQFVKQSGNAQFTGSFAEMWDGSALTANDLNQTIKALPAGMYSLSAKALAQKIDVTLYAKIGDVEKSVTFRSDEATIQTVWFKLDETSDVQIGFKQNAGGSSGAKWVAVDDFSLTYATELPDATDITNFIKNNSFEVNGTEGWTVTGTMGAGPNDNIGGKDGGVYIEAYNPDGDRGVEQTISNLVPGLYEVTVLGRARDMQDAQVYATAGSTTNSTMFTNNVTDNYSVVIDLHQGESLTLGAKCTNTATDKRWFALDNFRLVYRPTLAVVDGKMNADVQSAMTTAVETYNNDKTVANYNAAKATIPAAKASVKQYEDAKIALDAQKDLMDNSNMFTEAAQTTYNNIYTTLLDKYKNNTLTNMDGVVNPTVATGWRANPVDAANLIMSQWDETNYNWDSYHANTWSTEGNTDGSNFRVPFVEYWTADGSSLAAKTITTKEIDVENGVYSLTAWVRVRAKNETAATDATGITLQVNDGEAVDVTEGTQIGTGQYTIAEVTAYGEVTNGKLVVKFNVAEDNNISWLAFKNIKYVKTNLASTSQVEEFKQALQDAKSKTLGFEDGEYAPYNNVEAIAALKIAQALDVENPIEAETLSNAKDALDNATWTANEGEVNAIYDGGFSLTTKQEGGYLVPTGWTNLGYNTRVYNSTNKGSNTGVDAGSEGGCLFAKYTTSYGTVDGYTMPLKAGAYYLNFIYGGWNEVGTRDIKVYKKDDASTAATVTPNEVTAKNNQAHVSADAWTSYNGIVIIPEDGEYVLEFYRQSTTSQNQIAISDIELKTAATYARTTANEKYGTLCLPYAFNATGAGLYTVTGVEDNVITLTEAGTAGTAGQPYVYQATADEQTFTQKSAPVAEPVEDTYLVGSFKSAAEGLMVVPQNAYVLQTQNERQGFFKVTSDNIKCGMYKCYLRSDAPGLNSRSAIFFDGDETAINALDALTSGEAQIYDLNGRKLNKLQKGINIVNGVKIIVK